MSLHNFDLNEVYQEDHDNIDQQIHDREDNIQDETIPLTEDDEDVIDSQIGDDGGTYETFENRIPNCMLNNEERKIVYSLLLQKSKNGKLGKTHTTEVSNLLRLPLKTVQIIWKAHKTTPPGVLVDISHRKTINCGRKRVQIDENSVLQVPLNNRTTSRSLGAALGWPHSTNLKFENEGQLRHHTNAIKPFLKKVNKITRVRFCTSMIDWSIYPQETKFIGMYNYVHIDEKWFYMTKKSEKIYLLPTEDEPLRTCQRKNFICKVMFLVAMARPRYDHDGMEIFSGKIRVFPFINMIAAQRRSRNRDVGTMEMKPVTSVTREVIRSCLIGKVIPATQNVWTQENPNEIIFIRQDNSRTYVDPSDTQFRDDVSNAGLNIQLVCQPPNSQDFNILDLGFFSAIQSLQHKESPKTVDELVRAVVKSYNEYPSERINHVWLSLQLCMQETLKVGGSNGYKVLHINKLQLQRNGQLPIQIPCNPVILQIAMNNLVT